MPSLVMALLARNALLPPYAATIVCEPRPSVETVSEAWPVASTETGGPSGVAPSSKVTLPEPTVPPEEVTAAWSCTGAPATAGFGPAVTVVVVGDDVGTIETSSVTVAVSAASTFAGGTMPGASEGDTDSSTTIVTGGTTETSSETETDSVAGNARRRRDRTASLVPTGSSLPTPAGGAAVEPSPGATLSSTTIATVSVADGAAPAGSTSRPRPHTSASSSNPHRTAGLLPVRRPATVIPRSPPSYEKLSLTVTEMSCPDRTGIAEDSERSVISL